MPQPFVLLATPHGATMSPDWLDAFLSLEKPYAPNGASGRCSPAVSELPRAGTPGLSE